jgi:AraC-like DNA-binding protein
MLYNFTYYIFGLTLLNRVYYNLSSIDIKNKIFVSVVIILLFSFFILLDLIHLPFISVHEPTKVVIRLSQKIGLLIIWSIIVFKEFERKFITINFNFSKSKELIQPVMQKNILPNPKSDLADIRLISFWENESNIYLEKDFNLDRLCKHLKMERKIVVSLLYDTYQQNFNEILNRYRIYHFVQKSKADKNKFQKFETIIQDCGYSNRSTFYLAFKKISKQTPSEFVKNMYSND